MSCVFVPGDRFCWNYQDQVLANERVCRQLCSVWCCIVITHTQPLPRCFCLDPFLATFSACRAPSDGSALPQCIEVGFTQTAYIVECGGEFENDAHCGTFLEIHRPGPDYMSVLAEAKLRGQTTSGYRMTVLSTTCVLRWRCVPAALCAVTAHPSSCRYKGNASQSLCVGDHEVWWVLRTKCVRFSDACVCAQALLPAATAAA